MDEFLWLTGSGDEVEPAARDVHGGVEAEDAVGERVAMVMVVEEPGVEVGVAQGGLDCGDFHGPILCLMVDGSSQRGIMRGLD